MDTTATESGKRRRLNQALSDRAVKAARAPGRMFDGNGLFLLVTERGPNVSKVWKQRITVNGHRQELGLGRYPVVTLAKARDKALANLRMVDDGLNPKIERRRARGIPTFAELARADFEHRKAGWRNEKHAAQWIGTLEEFAFPLLGDRTVDTITVDDVFRVLSPLWHKRPTTAKRLRQRIAAVLAVAVAKGHRADNPADTVKAMLAKHQAVETKGHRALAYVDVAGALAKVRESSANRSTVLALEFLVLTAARAGEVRFATWNEIDTDAATWTVPAERMKAGREHRVPLSARALEILAEAMEIGNARTDLIFPGRGGRVLGERVHAASARPARHRRNGPRLPVELPGVGGGANHDPARSLRGGARAHHQGQGRSRIPAFRSVRPSRRPDGAMGGVPVGEAGGRGEHPDRAGGVVTAGKPSERAGGTSALTVTDLGGRRRTWTVTTR